MREAVKSKSNGFEIVSALLALFLFTGVESRQAQAETVKDLYARVERDYQSAVRAPEQKTREQWEQLIRDFVSIGNKFPQSQEGYNSLYTAGRLYHRLYTMFKRERDLDMAMKHYADLVAGYPGGALADDALFQTAEILIERKKYEEARAVFGEIVQLYPQGDQVYRSRKKIKELEVYGGGRKALAAIKGVVFSGDAQRAAARVTIRTSGEAKFTSGHLRNPERFYVDLENVRLDNNLQKDIAVTSLIVKQIRLSQFSPEMSRVVLDLRRADDVQIIARRNGENEIAIELEENGAKGSGAAVAEKPASAAAPKAAVVKAAQMAPVKRKPGGNAAVAQNDAAPLIVIDPGHGGKDDGARGAGGLLEKDRNLVISQRLKDILERKYRYRVAMTRTDDTFIPLDKRGEMANEMNADLFVSIHVNAAERKAARGIETYYLGRGSTARAQETAARENGEIVYSVPDTDVQKILVDMITNKKLNNSSCLARFVQERLVHGMAQKYSEVKNLGVKEGPFFVLHNTKMPSILVEVGFITNVDEEKRLEDKGYVTRLAESIARGIQNALPVQERCAATI